MEKEDMPSAISLGFTLLSLAIQFLRDAGVPEDVIEASWSEKKMMFYSRPSEDLKKVEE